MKARKLPPINATVNVLPNVESKWLSRLSAIVNFVGSTGSGKSTTCLSLVVAMRKAKELTKLYIISPTYESVPLWKAVVKDGDFVYSGDDVFAALKEVEKDADVIGEMYMDRLEHQIAIQDYKAGKSLTPRQENFIEQWGWKQEAVQRPALCLILDDLSHSKIFSSSRQNPLVNLVLRSRWVGQGLGLTIMMLAQNCKGLPKVLRLNCTHGFYWSTQSVKEIQSIYEDVGGIVSYKEFEALFREYTSTKHSFLFCDNIRKELKPNI
jgi:energy-coupling factor transporter ATP-binding protein EcfA2